KSIVSVLTRVADEVSQRKPVVLKMERRFAYRYANEDDGSILGYPTMLSRAFVGTYIGSDEAFLEDVREVWHNIRTAYRDQQDLMLFAEQLSGNLESLVLDLVQKMKEYGNP
ncbi:hypothetical protein C5167_020263, partial [Papaver somniferum]